MQVSLIAALTRKGHIIGSKSGGLPWRLPKDQSHFRAYTSGKPILLGRRTFGEMRGWFTSQNPIFVLTKNPDFLPHTPVTTLSSVADALALAKSQKHPELVVGGGGSVFEATLPFATRLVLTWVEADLADLPSPVRFPDFDPLPWRVAHTQSWPADNANPHPMTLEILVL